MSHQIDLSVVAYFPTFSSNFISFKPNGGSESGSVDMVDVLSTS